MDDATQVADVQQSILEYRRAYNPADPSLNTAVEGATGNFLGPYGAIFADLLVQSLGLSAFLLPLILIGWAFRLLLQRPLLHMSRRLLMVVPALLLGSFVGAVLHVAPEMILQRCLARLSPPAHCYGRVRRSDITLAISIAARAASVPRLIFSSRQRSRASSSLAKV